MMPPPPRKPVPPPPIEALETGEKGLRELARIGAGMAALLRYPVPESVRELEAVADWLARVRLAQ